MVMLSTCIFQRGRMVPLSAYICEHGRMVPLSACVFENSNERSCSIRREFLCYMDLSEDRAISFTAYCYSSVHHF